MSDQLDYRIFEARPLPWREAVANLTDLAADYERRGEWGMADIALHEAVDVATEGGADGASLAAVADAREALHEREDAAAEAACVVCGTFIPDQLECPACLSVCCPGCRERHAPDCSGTPGVGPTPPTEPLADVLARKEATDAAR